MYYIYILRCSDNSLYTGITNDYKKRFESHINKTTVAAKYTKSRQVVDLCALWSTPLKSDALKLEYRIKQLPKAKKESLILNNDLFSKYFSDMENVYTKEKQV